MSKVINLELMSNPVNWVTVTLVVMMAGIGLDLLARTSNDG